MEKKMIGVVFPDERGGLAKPLAVIFKRHTFYMAANHAQGSCLLGSTLEISEWTITAV